MTKGKWKWWCSSCGTLTNDRRYCDCTGFENTAHLQKLEPYDEEDRTDSRVAGEEQSR